MWLRLRRRALLWSRLGLWLWLRRRTLLRSRLGLLLRLRSRTLLRSRLGLLLRLRSRTLLRSRFSLLLRLRSRTLLRSRFSLLLRLRSRTLLRSRLGLWLWLRRRTLLRNRLGLWLWLRSRTLLRSRLGLLLWLRSRTLLRSGLGLWLWLRRRTLLQSRLGLWLWLRRRALLRSRPSLFLWPLLGSGALVWLCVHRRRSRGRSRPSRNHRSDRFACRDGLRRCNNGRTPVIDRVKLLAVLCCRLLVLHLRVHGRNALLTQCGGFRRQGLASYASRPVVAGAVYRGVVDGGVVDDRIRYRTVVHVNVGDVHIVDGTVVVETISVPVAALIADADVAVSIVNPAVVADITTPIAVVVAIPTAEKSPVSGRPQEAHLRRLRPGARHPVIALRSVAPISGRPQIAIARNRRLRVFGQWWRGLLGLEHRLAVGCILNARVVIVIGIALVLIVIALVLRGRRLLSALIRRRRLLVGRLCRLLRRPRLLIGLLRRLTPVRGSEIGRSRWILRLVGLRRLILVLGSIILATLVASCESESQHDGCGCQKDKRRYSAGLAHKRLFSAN